MYFPLLSELKPQDSATLSQKVNELYKKISKNRDFNLIKIEESNQKKLIRTFIDEISSSLKSRINYTDKYDEIFMDFIECNNTKIKAENGKWKWPSAYESFANKYPDGQHLIKMAKSIPFLKNAETILGKSGEKIILLGAICFAHGENPYNIMVNEIGLENLLIISSVLSDSADVGFSFATIHSPESYVSQLMSIDEASLIR